MIPEGETNEMKVSSCGTPEMGFIRIIDICSNLYQKSTNEQSAIT
jgi:hypothetical protein